MKLNPHKFGIQPYTQKQLAAYYGVGIKTFHSWIESIQDKLGDSGTHLFTSNQVLCIVHHFGNPLPTEEENQMNLYGFRYKAYSKKQIASIYGVTFTKFSTWVKPFEKEIGKEYGKCYTIKQIRYIVSQLGLPYSEV